MLANFNPDHYESLVNSWLKAEEQGEQFPVPFDAAWQMAGYSRESDAKRRLQGKSSYLKADLDYTIQQGTFLRQSPQSVS